MKQDNYPGDVKSAPPPSSSSHSYFSSGGIIYPSPALDDDSQPLPRAHAKIYDEAAEMADELMHHYEFCVEMQLMCEDEELHGSIHLLKSRFRSCIYRAAGESSMTCEARRVM